MSCHTNTRDFCNTRTSGIRFTVLTLKFIKNSILFLRDKLLFHGKAILKVTKRYHMEVVLLCMTTLFGFADFHEDIKEKPDIRDTGGDCDMIHS